MPILVSYADILWAHHLIFLPTNICRSQGNIPSPLFARVPIMVVAFAHRSAGDHVKFTYESIGAGLLWYKKLIDKLKRLTSASTLSK